MDNGDIILQQYKEAFSRYAKDGVIDLDARFKVKFSFQIRPLEDFVTAVQGIVPPSRQSQYFVTLVKTGSGEKSIGHFTFAIKKNTLLCIPKRAMNSTQYWGQDCSGYMLSFNLDFFLQKGFPKKLIVNKRLFKNSVRPYLRLSEQEEQKLEAIFVSIFAEYKNRHDEKNELIAVKILELLIECDRLYEKACGDCDEFIYHDILEMFNELLEKNSSTQRSVRFYADALHIHPNYLNSLCQKHTGLSAKETINNHILNEAKYLLASSPLTIKEIASELGFDHTEYFSTFFRKGTSLSPVAYRSQLV